MMKRMSVVCVALVGCVAAIAIAAPQGGGDLPGEADFTGKVLITASSGVPNGVILEQASIRRVGGRAFLVGNAFTLSDGDKGPSNVAWLPVDNLQYIAEFDSVEEIKEYYRNRMPFAKKAEPGVGADSR